MKLEGIGVIYKYASPVKKCNLQSLEEITFKMDKKTVQPGFPLPLLSGSSFIAKLLSFLDEFKFSRERETKGASGLSWNVLCMHGIHAFILEPQDK